MYYPVNNDDVILDILDVMCEIGRIVFVNEEVFRILDTYVISKPP